MKEYVISENELRIIRLIAKLILSIIILANINDYEFVIGVFLIMAFI